MLLPTIFLWKLEMILSSHVCSQNTNLYKDEDLRLGNKQYLTAN